MERLRVSAYSVSLNLATLEANVNVLADLVLLFLSLVDEVLALVIRAESGGFGVSNIDSITSSHCSHHYLIVIVELRIVHLKLVVYSASFREVNKLSIVVTSLMLVVDIISVLHKST